MKRIQTILCGAMALTALLFASKKAKTARKVRPTEYQAEGRYVPDSLAIHHWLS